MIIPKNKLQGLKAHFKSEKDPLTDKPIEIKFTFNEFVKVDGLTLKSISIDDGIILEGSFKRGIKIDFFVKVELIECAHNIIVARIVKAFVIFFLL